ncbi:2-keto-3-deoxygluconate permease [Citrobacter koseri]|nr:2-keto-3-deoxygluconate permease [Citrobacter koseri]
MKIKATIERIPGGMMLIPLLLGAILNTLAPDTGAYFGSFTKGMISGTVPILAVWFFCIGASIDLRATGTVLRKSGTLVITKIAVAWVVAMIAASFIPDTGIQTGFFAGLSVLAIVSAMDMTNGGLYASLMNQYGTKEESGAFVLMSLESGPLMTMVDSGFRRPRLLRTASLCRRRAAVPDWLHIRQPGPRPARVLQQSYAGADPVLRLCAG